MTDSTLAISHGHHPIHLTTNQQLSIVQFETPLQQVLQEQQHFLRLLNQQTRWQIWLSSRPMLKRSWLQQVGLDEHKVVHIANMNCHNMVDFIERALMSKNASYLVACVADITESERHRLQIAVKSSGTHLFLIRDDHLTYHDFMTLSKQLRPLN